MRTCIAIIAALVTAMWLGGCAQPGAVRAVVDANTQVAVASPQLSAAVEAQVAARIETQVVARVETKLAAAVDQAMKVVQKAGAQVAKDHSVNVGPVAISGSAWPFVALGIVAGIAAYFWQRKRKAETTTDLLVQHNEDRGIDQAEKDQISLSALRRGVEGDLHARVVKVRKEATVK